MRSVFLNNRATHKVANTIDDDTSEEERFIANSSVQHYELSDVERLLASGDFEQSACAYVQCFAQFQQQQQIELYAVLFEHLAEMDAQTQARLLLKYSTCNSAQVYLPRILEHLPQYLQSENPVVKRRCYKLSYNVYIDFQDVSEGRCFNELIEQQMLADMISCSVRSVQRVIIQVERARVMAGCTTHDFTIHVVRTYIQQPDLLKYVAKLVETALQADDSGALIVSHRQTIEQTISASMAHLSTGTLIHGLFSALLSLLEVYFKSLARSDPHVIAALLKVAVSSGNCEIMSMYLNFLEQQLSSIPLVDVTRCFALEDVCAIMGCLRIPELQEATLDVFIKLQTSYEPQWQWFVDVCAVNVSNENMAYSVAIALDDFLDQDEAFWVEMREHWDRVRSQLDPYPDQQDFIERVIQGFQMRGV